MRKWLKNPENHGKHPHAAKYRKESDLQIIKK